MESVHPARSETLAGPFLGETPARILRRVDLPLFEWPASAISGSMCLNLGHGGVVEDPK